MTGLHLIALLRPCCDHFALSSILFMNVMRLKICLTKQMISLIVLFYRLRFAPIMVKRAALRSVKHLRTFDSSSIGISKTVACDGCSCQIFPSKRLSSRCATNGATLLGSAPHGRKTTLQQPRHSSLSLSHVRSKTQPSRLRSGDAPIASTGSTRSLSPNSPESKNIGIFCDKNAIA